MTEERGKDLKDRTKKFASRIIRLFTALPKKTKAQVIGKQILRSGTSVAAPFAEACRARSNAESIGKIESGTQSLEETMYWLELLVEAEIFRLKNSKIYKKKPKNRRRFGSLRLKRSRREKIINSSFIIPNSALKYYGRGALAAA